jgi:hypothetical protein
MTLIRTPKRSPRPLTVWLCLLAVCIVIWALLIWGMASLPAWWAEAF